MFGKIRKLSFALVLAGPTYQNRLSVDKQLTGFISECDCEDPTVCKTRAGHTLPGFLRCPTSIFLAQVLARFSPSFCQLSLDASDESRHKFSVVLHKRERQSPLCGCLVRNVERFWCKLIPCFQFLSDAELEKLNLFLTPGTNNTRQGQTVLLLNQASAYRGKKEDVSSWEHSPAHHLPSCPQSTQSCPLESCVCLCRLQTLRQMCPHL